MLRFVFVVIVIGVYAVDAVSNSTCRACGKGGECCDSASDGENFLKYIFTIPLTFTAGTYQMGCLTLHRENVETLDVEVSVDLQLINGNIYDVFKTVARPTDDEICFKLKVPRESTREKRTRMARVNLNMTYTVEQEQHHIHAEQRIFIFQPEFEVYINTDKYVYKPGQTVLFRVLQLEGLLPANYTVEKITISDNRTRKLLVLTDRSPHMGLVSDKFELVTEPNLGMWSITVQIEGREYRTTFKVEEYVLPKFEVSITVPKFVHIESGPFPVLICAKYVHGNPVNGSVLYRISKSGYGPVHTNKQATDKNGCLSIIADPVELELHHTSSYYYFYTTELLVRAEVTDYLTGITESSHNTECKITNKPFVIDVEKKGDHFMPGLPFTMEIFFHDISGAPLAGKEIVVKVIALATVRRSDSKTTYSNTITNDHGRSIVHLPTSRDVGFYDIEIYDPSLPEFTWGRHNAEKNYRGEASFWISRIGKNNTGYIDIDKVDRKHLDCTQLYEMTGKVIIDLKRSESHVSFPDIFYRVSVGDELIDHGRAHITNEICAPAPLEQPEDQNIPGTCQGEFSVSINMENWSVGANVLVYMAYGEQIIADKIKIPLSCLPNKVSVIMSDVSTSPGSDVQIGIIGDPGSFCALTIRDKSVHLMGLENEITEGKIASGLKDEHRKDFLKLTDNCDVLEGFEDIFSTDEDGFIERRPNSFYYGHSYFRQEYAVAKIFQDAMMILLTNYDAPISPCKYPSPMEYAVAADSGPYFRSSGRSTEAIEVRNYFPETWIWDLHKIGLDGTISIPATIPDTITEWIASSFCISPDSGIGIAKETSITGFKPIFLSVSLPYSVVRGEEITLKAVLYSYLEQDICLEMVITIDHSDDFTLLDEDSSSLIRCICGGEAQSIDYEIKPLTLGEVKFTLKTWSENPTQCDSAMAANPDATDGVERILLVEPEGIERETTNNNFICLDKLGPQTFTSSLDVDIPEDHYDGSSRLLVNVIGSIMGPVLDNLDHLIQAPYGCGEQNMVTMVPNIVVHKYLTAVGKMTPELKRKIENNIRRGYQRQLNYQRRDGSFSAFGDGDDEGSTWLTAFVISTFKDAKKYTAIDDGVLERAMDFLLLKTKRGNCFKKIGLVHHKAMMGGADGGNALDAYVKLALRDSSNSTDEDTSENDIHGCDGSSNLKVYTRAIKFYTNALKGKEEAANYLWDSLKMDARFEDGDNFENAGRLFWSDEEPRESNHDENVRIWWHYEKPSDAVEVTAYVLLGYLKMEGMNPDRYPIEDSYRIVQWLTSERNAKGGFSSTQNTVLGLTALAMYASRTITSEQNLTVRISYEDEDIDTFEIDNENNLVVQQSLTKPAPSAITYEVNGYGCALIQTNTIFNTPQEPTDPSFTVSVHVHGYKNGCDSPGPRQLIACATYQGNDHQPSSNMAVFEITMVSGYEADLDSLKEMAAANLHNGLKRYEVDGKKINIYFEEISSERKCAAFEVKQIQVVKNPQPGLVHVFDYYDPVKSSIIKYNLSCVWETYDKESLHPDCLRWSKDGHCIRFCMMRRISNCLEYANLPKPNDFCNSRRNLCGDTGDCKNTEFYYRCACHPGYIPSDFGRCQEITLINIQEPGPVLPPVLFQPPMLNADSNELSCANGYKLSESGGGSHCEDIDECANITSCNDDNSVCVNSLGSYSCICEDGFMPTSDSGDVDCVPVMKVLPDLSESIGGDEVDRLSAGCPTCRDNFPSDDEFSTVFCPKTNIFIGSQQQDNENRFTLRLFSGDGITDDGDVFRNVDIVFENSCECPILKQKKKFYFITEESITGNQISGVNSKIVPKQASKKVRNYRCP